MGIRLQPRTPIPTPETTALLLAFALDVLAGAMVAGWGRGDWPQGKD